MYVENILKKITFKINELLKRKISLKLHSIIKKKY
jgi:hypothetical protein